MATFSKNLSVTSSGVYTLEMNLIPTGSTVTPVNDIQTWLHCANIWNKNYTTLAQVLADTSTLNSLIQSNNAADYMARSTDWCSNPNLIPKMTSNTTPSGVASSYGAWGGYEAYLAFDNNELTSYSSSVAAQAGLWLQYKFTSGVVAKKCYLCTSSINAGSVLKIQGSNNGSSWTDLASHTVVLVDYYDKSYIDLNNSTSYMYYRVYISSGGGSNSWAVQTFALYGKNSTNCIVDNQTAMTYIGANNYCATKLLSNSTWCTEICNSTYFEKVLTTKIPTMTSNTAPSGLCECSSKSSGYEPWSSFDANEATTWAEAHAVTTGSWLSYKFSSSMMGKKFRLKSGNVGNGSIIKIQGSNNGTNWTDLATITVISTGGAYDDQTVISTSNTTKYLYYRAYMQSPVSLGYGWNVPTFQVWGRA